MRKNTVFAHFPCPDGEKKKEASVRTVLKLPGVPIANFDLNSPFFLRIVSKMTTPKNFGLPDPAKVRRSRFVSSKKHDF